MCKNEVAVCAGIGPKKVCHERNRIVVEALVLKRLNARIVKLYDELNSGASI